MQLSRATEGHA